MKDDGADGTGLATSAPGQLEYSTKSKSNPHGLSRISASNFQDFFEKKEIPIPSSRIPEKTPPISPNFITCMYHSHYKHREQKRTAHRSHVALIYTPTGKSIYFIYIFTYIFLFSAAFPCTAEKYFQAPPPHSFASFHMKYFRYSFLRPFEIMYTFFFAFVFRRTLYIPCQTINSSRMPKNLQRQQSIFPYWLKKKGKWSEKCINKFCEDRSRCTFEISTGGS